MPQAVAGAALIGGASVAAGGVAAAFAATGLTAFAAQLGASLVLSGVSAALMPKPKVAAQARTVSVRQPAAPREFVYGATRKGGVIVYMHETGSSNEYLHLVIALAGHQVESIGAVYFDGEEAIDASGTATSRYSGLVFIEKKLGSASQTALSQLQTDTSGEGAAAWTSDHRLRGIAHVHLRLKFDADAFPRGLPDIAFDIEGKNDIFDPRDSSTGYTTNPALCLADYMSDATYGIGAGIGDADGIDSTPLAAAANVCDEAVTLDAGGSEDRYACNGVLSLSETPKTNIEALLTAMAGRAVFPGGAWKIHAGAYRTPTVTLTDDDIRPQGLSVATRMSGAENFNGVRGQFVAPENDYQVDDFPAYQSATYLAEDQGEAKWRDIVLPFTQSSATAQRLAKIALETQRRQFTVQVRGKLSAWRCAVGETVQLTYSRWGWSAKPFVVVSTRLAVEDGALVTDLTLRETSSLVYSWAASEEDIYAAAPQTTLPSPFDLPAPTNVTCTGSAYLTEDNRLRKYRTVTTWTAALSAYVIRYEVEARRTHDASGTATGEDYRPVAVTGELRAELPDVLAGTWEWRVRGVSGLGVVTPWASDSIVIGNFDSVDFLEASKLTGDVLYSQIEAQNWANLVPDHKLSSTSEWATVAPSSAFVASLSPVDAEREIRNDFFLNPSGSAYQYIGNDRSRPFPVIPGETLVFGGNLWGDSDHSGTTQLGLEFFATEANAEAGTSRVDYLASTRYEWQNSAQLHSDVKFVTVPAGCYWANLRVRYTADGSGQRDNAARSGNLFVHRASSTDVIPDNNVTVFREDSGTTTDNTSTTLAEIATVEFTPDYDFAALVTVKVDFQPAPAVLGGLMESFVDLSIETKTDGGSWTEFWRDTIYIFIDRSSKTEIYSSQILTFSVPLSGSAGLLQGARVRHAYVNEDRYSGDVEIVAVERKK